MKPLSEIKRNIVSFYSTIQTRVNDFSVGSVISGIFYAVSSVLEGVYGEVDEVREQAYVSSATGAYLDKLIEGTFQLPRQPATRNVGYVVLYGNSPISTPDNVVLSYASFDYSSGEFISGVQTSTKFIGRSMDGESSIVYSLIQPKNADAIDPDTSTIDLGGRNIQFLLLPVASVMTGSQVSVREGDISSFPSPPPGLSGVLNTNTPGSVFFSNTQSSSGSPFYSRYTTVTSYTDGTGNIGVVNAYNFSDTGFLEINRDENDNTIVATYSDGSETREAGILLEYISASSTNISLKLPVVNSLVQVPTMKVVVNGVLTTLPLTGIKYLSIDRHIGDGTTTPSILCTTIQDDILHSSIAPVVTQRPDQITDDLIFDPDGVLNADYTLLSSARIAGASDEASDAEYRQSLIKYLASLTAGKKREIKEALEDEWKASSVNLIVKAPELLKLNFTISVSLVPGTSQEETTQLIRDTIQTYMNSKAPGTSVRYSDILTLVVDTIGVRNAFNLIISQYLEDSVYYANKADYDEAVLLQAKGSSTISTRSVGSALSAGDVGKMLKLASGGDTVVTSGADAILYSFNSTSDYEVLETSEPVLASALYYAIVSSSTTITVESLKGAIHSFQDGTEYSGAFGNANEYQYFLSYLLSNPFPGGDVPTDPDTILYENIQDYQAELTEVYRATSITLDITPIPLIGIRYVIT